MFNTIWYNFWNQWSIAVDLLDINIHPYIYVYQLDDVSSLFYSLDFISWGNFTSCILIHLPCKSHKLGYIRLNLISCLYTYVILSCLRCKIQLWSTYQGQICCSLLHNKSDHHSLLTKLRREKCSDIHNHGPKSRQG